MDIESYINRDSKSSEYHKIRVNKLSELLSIGINPYRTKFKSSVLLSDIKKHIDKIEKIAGRILNIRYVGKIIFISISQGLELIQGILNYSEVGEDKFTFFKKFFDIGDIIGCSGKIGYSKSGELSIFISEYVMTSKCLHPLPDQYYKLTDKDTKYRSRHIDLIVNNESKEILYTRFKIVQIVREFLINKSYIEVDTPMLQSMHGGANARPFVTYSNVYNKKLYLRIAPELYLKRLLIGGMDKIFELNKNFRNEGIDTYHNFEFTMLEGYCTYNNYDGMRELVQSLIQHTMKVCNVDRYLDLMQNWKVVDICEKLSEIIGIDININMDIDSLINICNKYKINTDKYNTPGRCIEELYELLLQKETINPTFYYNFPRETTPLAYPIKDGLAARWDLVIEGYEIATGYSELNNPILQYENFVMQHESKDEEAMLPDDEFLNALEYGIPHTGGFGVGIDRLIMILLSKNIRDITPFPMLR